MSMQFLLQTHLTLFIVIAIVNFAQGQSQNINDGVQDQKRYELEAKDIALTDGYFHLLLQDISGPPDGFKTKCCQSMERYGAQFYDENHELHIQAASIKQNGIQCDDTKDGVIKLRQIDYLKKPVLNVGHAQQVYDSLYESATTNSWVGSISNLTCSCCPFLSQTAVFIVRSERDTLKGPLSYPLSPLVIHYIFTNDKFTCVYRRTQRPTPGNFSYSCAAKPSSTPTSTSTASLSPSISGSPSPSMATMPPEEIPIPVLFPSSTPEPSKSVPIESPEILQSDEPDTKRNMCFPADAVVQLQNGSLTTMDSLSIGNRIFVEPNKTSMVFWFSHRSPNVTELFVNICVDKHRCVRCSPGHLIYVDDGRLTPAVNVTVGQFVHMPCRFNCTSMKKPFNKTKVKHVSFVRMKGLFNPHTVQGDLIVDGFRVSSFTTALAPFTAHSLLTPIRFSRLLVHPFLKF